RGPHHHDPGREEPGEVEERVKLFLSRDVAKVGSSVASLPRKDSAGDAPHRRLARKPRGQSTGGKTADRVAPGRRDLRQRNQGDPPPGQPRMRKNGIRTAPPDPSQVQDVNVDLAWAVFERPRPPEPPLDVLDRGEQLLRRSVPPNLRCGVPETPLL